MPRKGQVERKQQKSVSKKDETKSDHSATTVVTKNKNTGPKFIFLAEYRRKQFVLNEKDINKMANLSTEEKEKYTKERSQTSRFIVIAYSFPSPKTIQYAASVFRFNYLDMIANFRLTQPVIGSGTFRKSFKELEKKTFNTHKQTAAARYESNPIITPFDLPESLLGNKKESSETKEVPKDNGVQETTSVKESTKASKEENSNPTHHVCHACHQNVSVKQMKEVRQMKRAIRQQPAGTKKNNTNIYQFIAHKLRTLLGKFGTSAKSERWGKFVTDCVGKGLKS